MRERELKTRRRSRGASVVIVAAMLAVLIGFVGLVIDLGRLYIIKAELQTAMDSCALAAASRLEPFNATTGDTTVLTRADRFGRLMASRHSFSFQNTALDTAVGGPLTIDFSPTMSDGDFSSTLVNPTNKRFARCRYAATGIPIYFMVVLGAANSSNVGAKAVATRGPSSNENVCKMPVAVCGSSNLAGSNPPYGLRHGQWLVACSSAGGNPNNPPPGSCTDAGPGRFQWADIDGVTAGGADDIAALVKGAGYCGAGTPIYQSGSAASIVDEWNARFGVYRNGGGCGYPEKVTGTSVCAPDFTGYAYTNQADWPNGAYDGAYAGSSSPAEPNYEAAKAARRGFQGTVQGPYNTILTSAQLAANSTDPAGQYVNNRRIVGAPVFNCDSSTFPRPFMGYGCFLMLAPVANTQNQALEYIGPADDPGSPCLSTAVPGTGSASLTPVLVQ